MTKFIELTELDGTVLTINADCLQMVWEIADGHTQILVSVSTIMEKHTVKDSYEELKTKLGAI
ncbi:MAG: hypothetical protein J6589_09585 [Snodgrassella sp.]|uniref:hypothetical protein n=1 Tax=Snodgrassella sp. TaxID=2815304 RepID=UPI00258C0002|nr:hypothetical protein [Snodgrassella sp.]MCO6514699.1 hypothetical protein [Snodgrassella sp.]MCO6520503.1 hypothetical protein [Snodgrassella sp.]